mgnify:CR=1 FL=1
MRKALRDEVLIMLNALSESEVLLVEALNKVQSTKTKERIRKLLERVKCMKSFYKTAEKLLELLLKLPTIDQALLMFVKLLGGSHGR